MALLLLVSNEIIIIFFFWAICFLVFWDYGLNLFFSWRSSSLCLDINNFCMILRSQNIVKDINTLSLNDAEKWWNSGLLKLCMCVRKHLSHVKYNLSAKENSSILGLLDRVFLMTLQLWCVWLIVNITKCLISFWSRRLYTRNCESTLIVVAWSLVG